jgi:hypothetical protein
MSPKQLITREQMVRAHGPTVSSFLDTIEKLKPARISNGMWNKLYALIAIIRKAEHINYWIYQGPRYEYDVTNRQVSPVLSEHGMSIGNIIGGKHG